MEILSEEAVSTWIGVVDAIAVFCKKTGASRSIKSCYVLDLMGHKARAEEIEQELPGKLVEARKKNETIDKYIWQCETYETYEVKCARNHQNKYHRENQHKKLYMTHGPESISRNSSKHNNTLPTHYQNTTRISS